MKEEPGRQSQNPPHHQIREGTRPSWIPDRMQQRRRISGENDARQRETHPDYEQRRQLSATMGAHQTPQPIHRIHAHQRWPPAVSWRAVDAGVPGNASTSALHRRGEIDESRNGGCEVRCGRRRIEASKNAPATQKKLPPIAIGLSGDYIRETIKKLPPIRLSSYPTIIFGNFFEQPREKRNAM